MCPCPSTCGKEVFVGLLLEHKSVRQEDVMSQIYRYVFEVMVKKSVSAFKWYPTKAIIIYNGTKNWNPVKSFYKKHPEIVGSIPFECVLVNLNQLDDGDCFGSDNAEAAMGALVMKYSFDSEKLKETCGQFGPLLKKLNNDARKLFVQKIELYLSEYIDDNLIKELSMEFKSIGQRLGFVSAADLRRKAEAEGRREGFEKGVEKGFEKGIEKGIEKGLSQGLAKGERNKARQMAKAMLANGLAISLVANISGLTEEELKNL